MYIYTHFSKEDLTPHDWAFTFYSREAPVKIYSLDGRESAKWRVQELGSKEDFSDFEKEEWDWDKDDGDHEDDWHWEDKNEKWLFDEIKESEMTRLYKLAAKYTELFYDTGGLQDFKNDEYDRFMKIQSELSQWTKLNGMEEFTNEQIVEELLGDFKDNSKDIMGDFDWEDLAKDVQWLVENVSEEDMAKLYDIVYRFADLFAQTSGFTEFKDDKSYDQYQKIQYELQDWSKSNGFDRFQSYYEAVESLLDKLDFVEGFNWD